MAVAFDTALSTRINTGIIRVVCALTLQRSVVASTARVSPSKAEK
jgi:hypothetical protein